MRLESQSLTRGSKEIRNTHTYKRELGSGKVCALWWSQQLLNQQPGTPVFMGCSTDAGWGGWLAVEADSDSIQKEDQALVARLCTHRSLTCTGSPKESFAITLEPHPGKTLPLWG